ncbi:hypothetical protein CHLNCDRAFT_134730 [Chlorella variabilis]|uniref:Amino acid transporter transmembrane domain-containing protein n=1 Tax=Chlorella variabilis TaxID=554065 RepID=E1ZGM5_CHLVA|nr:hypothetical protein CHLNCDRAFT_134730 [Chlorella variabilis]EFN54961.1 hypothetical protein CHLNCDRAFT_134730 [Chlorella variabilis]|eukprot:XP_005847063.1 hypothetical protein CHLNCDRAFT_134730 [Chlorella variabilis]
MAGKPSEAAPLLIQVCTACGAASSPAQSGAPGVELSARTETAGGSSQPPAGTPAALGTPWGITTALLLADMFGIGSLALPGVFARLGWLVSVSLLVAFALGCGYLGILFSKLAVAVPSAQSMDEIGAAAMGKTGKRLVYALAGSAIVVDPIALHIVSMLAVQQIFPALGTLAASAVVAACMLPLAQIQSIHDAAWLSLVATVCMICAVLATLFKLLAIEGSQWDATSLLPPPGTRGIEGLIAALCLCFAFGGQVNWMRYISSMQHREDFRFSAELADATFSVFYVLISVVGYSKLGPNFDHSKPITSVLPWDWWTVVINTALLIRCLVAYVLNANVFSDLFCRLGRPWLSKLEDASPRMGRRASWALVSCSCVIMSFLVAYAVPKFDLVLAVIAVVGDVAAPYTLPALFGLKLLPDLHRWERWLLKTLVAVSVLFALFGGYAALYTLLETLAD